MDLYKSCLAEGWVPIWKGVNPYERRASNRDDRDTNRLYLRLAKGTSRSWTPISFVPPDWDEYESLVKRTDSYPEPSTSSRDGRSPLLHDPLLSLAIVTWRNAYMCSFVPGTCNVTICARDIRSKIIKFGNSTDLADGAMEWLILQAPDFFLYS
ncbi:hypothetical protein PsorP6_007821 [Peronosclerospora sorghi]|uniref:Uncharacterized protein n=1 Tax=Peronosclerospora sorghi TaxID=230839 RepID=A0ACC0W6P3_9STRA|nr:hypothetical protein PsorP6_007821 [Peronosclerospora sorghi]